MIPERDDEVEAARRRVIRQEFRRMVEDDPLLTRLEAATRYPRLQLRSTVLLCLATLALAFLRQNVVVAVLVGLAVTAGHLCVVHLLAGDDEPAAVIVLRVIRWSCGVAAFLFVAGAVLAPFGPAGVSPSPAPTGVHAGTDPAPADGTDPAGQPAGGTAGTGQGTAGTSGAGSLHAGSPGSPGGTGQVGAPAA